MTARKVRFRFAALALGALASCVMASAALARHHHRAQDSGVAGRFDYYLLSLSWSPSYCIVHPQDQRQCSRGFGFVLHGLWPQNDDGGYPQNCAVRNSELTAEAAALGQTLYPSSRLMQHEWQRHGSCTGMDAVSFFRTADRAMAVIKVPAVLQAPRSDQSMSVQEIAAAFRAANPALGEHGMTVACSRDRFSEVRICLTRQLTPRSCGPGVRNSCPDVALYIPAAR